MYKVEKVLKVQKLAKGHLEWYIKWKDWEDIYNTWEPLKNLNCPVKLQEFYNQN